MEIRGAVRTLPARAVLALTIYGEARGEPVEGQVAVGWVIKNRAAKRMQTIQEVCLAPAQFSCWWGDDVNALRVRDRARRVLLGEVPADARWLAILQVAHQVLVGAIADPTAGSDHYLTTALYESDPPAWAKTMPVVAVIGRHTFLRDNGLRRA